MLKKGDESSRNKGKKSQFQQAGSLLGNSKLLTQYNAEN